MRILFIAYHFPPIGGAGVQRSAKFVRYLPEFGIDPTVIAGPVEAHSRWEPDDSSQIAELPPDLTVLRPDEPPPELERPSRIQQVMGRATQRDRWWQDQILRLGEQALDSENLDAIYITLLPYEGLKAAVELSRRHRLPLIADLRDPWALDDVKLYLSAFHRFAERRTMGSLLSECDMVIANTADSARAISEAFPKLDPMRIATITNGYDRDDFEGLEPRAPDGRFRIVHTGYLHTSLGLDQQRHKVVKTLLGGELVPVDLLSRSHAYLLEAIAQLAISDRDLASRIDLVLAGVLSDIDRQFVEDSPIAKSVRMTGYLEHRAAIQEMAKADVLFLPMHNTPDGHRARIVPGKTYEYLASGRPILAAVPAGDARDLITALDAGVIVNPSSSGDMAEAIIRMAREAPYPQRTLAGVEVFERRALTKDLAEVLQSMTS